MTTRYTTSAALAVLLALGGACGDDTSAADAGPTDDAFVSGVDATAACVEFGDPSHTLSSFPGAFSGDLEVAGADITIDACTDEVAPFGVETPGPDDVLALTNLAGGTEYAVRLLSGDDLGFYVVTSCSANPGPSADECLLYVDQTTAGDEAGTFVAPDDGNAFVVIDHYQTDAPDDSSFSVEVYAVECEEASACGGPDPHCVNFRCVDCEDDFDCTDRAEPICNTITNECAVGYAECVGDDGKSFEQGDDGPAGATDITPTVGDEHSVMANICNAPAEERDFYSFTVEQPGESYMLSLDWTDDVDLDLAVYDVTGELWGLSFHDKPEPVALTYLPIGTYYVAVDFFANGLVATASSYTLSVTRDPSSTCTGVADCAAEYRNQVYRGDCVSGACVAIEGNGQLPLAAACDSTTDCSTDDDEFCASFFFAADADTRSVCAPSCETDGECEAALGAEYVCTTYLIQNFCVQKCTMDDHCPALLTLTPSTPPWARLECEVASGKCRF
jgi:hypothetical protein